MKKAALALVPVALSVPGLVNTAEGQVVVNPVYFSGGYASSSGGMYASYYINADQGATTVWSYGSVDAETSIECQGGADGGNASFYWYGVSGLSVTTYWDTAPVPELGYWYTYNGNTSWRYYGYPHVQVYSPVSRAASHIQGIDGSSGSANAFIYTPVE